MAEARHDPCPDVFIGGGFFDPTADGPFVDDHRAEESIADAHPVDQHLDDRHPVDVFAPDAYGVHAHGDSARPKNGGDGGDGETGAPGSEHWPDPGQEPGPEREPEGERPPGGVWRDGAWRRGRLPIGLAALTGALLAGHEQVPNAVGNLGSLLDTLLPWTGLAVLALLPLALLRRSGPAVVAVVALGSLWAAVFGPVLLRGAPGSEGNLTVVSHNVGADNPDPAATARSLLAADPDLVALQEITDASMPGLRKTLDRELTHSVRVGTVALWSRHPITASRQTVIDPGWQRSLRAEVRGPDGPLAVHVVHLPSVRVGLYGFGTGNNDRTLASLEKLLEQERRKKVLLMGDLNAGTADRRLAPLTGQLASVQDEAGSGLGLSWPAAFPLARIDHILTRGVAPAASWTLPATGSDHLPVAARLTA